jgi:hypothetical protein
MPAGAEKTKKYFNEKNQSVGSNMNTGTQNRKLEY